MRKFLFFLLLFITFNLCYSYEVALRKIELINLNPKYEEFIKDFFLQNFENVEFISSKDKNLKKYKYLINVKIGMLSNTFNSCVEIYPRNENYSYINCITSFSFEEIPESLITLTKDILKLKNKKREKINLLIYTNSKNKFSGIFLLTNKMEVILYDKKISKLKPSGNLIKIYPEETKYNLFYLNENNSLKIVKLIFNGVKIENIYLKEREK